MSLSPNMSPHEVPSPNFSRSPTMTTDLDIDADPSQTERRMNGQTITPNPNSNITLTDLNASLGAAGTNVDKEKVDSVLESDKAVTTTQQEGAEALSSLPAGRKSILMLCFCLS